MFKKQALIPGSLLIGVAGGVTASYIIDDLWFASVIFFLASCAGACTIVFFGRHGRDGWGWALWGACLATFGSSAAAGLILVLDRFYEVPMLVGATLWEHPVNLLLWVVFMSLAHVVTRTLREM